MKTQGEHIRTLRRRIDFLKTRDYRNSYDQAELGALEWALVNLPPAQRAWVGLTDEEIEAEFGFIDELLRDCCYRIEAKLKEKNT